MKDRWVSAGYPESAINDMALRLTDMNFDTEVIRSGQTVLVDFWAPWCGPCQMMGPIIDELAQELKDVKVGKLDVDENPETAALYGVMSIPTLKIFKSGEIVKDMMGVQSKDNLKEILSKI